MSEKHNRIVLILVKYALKQELSEDEQRLLEEWRSRSASHEAMPDELRDPEWREEQEREAAEAPSGEVWQHIRQFGRGRKDKEYTKDIALKPIMGRKMRRQHWSRRYNTSRGNMLRVSRWVAAASVVL